MQRLARFVGAPEERRATTPGCQHEVRVRASSHTACSERHRLKHSHIPHDIIPLRGTQTRARARTRTCACSACVASSTTTAHISTTPHEPRLTLRTEQLYRRLPKHSYTHCASIIHPYTTPCTHILLRKHIHTPRIILPCTCIYYTFVYRKLIATTANSLATTHSALSRRFSILNLRNRLKKLITKRVSFLRSRGTSLFWRHRYASCVPAGRLSAGKAPRDWCVLHFSRTHGRRGGETSTTAADPPSHNSHTVPSSTFARFP